MYRTTGWITAIRIAESMAQTKSIMVIIFCQLRVLDKSIHCSKIGMFVDGSEY